MCFQPHPCAVDDDRAHRGRVDKKSGNLYDHADLQSTGRSAGRVLDGLEEECGTNENKKEKQGGEILSSPEGSDFSFGKTRRILWVTSMMRRY